eukprot:6985694-Heterocapsa_arctica.AAC.1
MPRLEPNPKHAVKSSAAYVVRRDALDGNARDGHRAAKREHRQEAAKQAAALVAARARTLRKEAVGMLEFLPGSQCRAARKSKT